MKKISLLTIFGLLSLFIGCASVPMAPTEQDAEAKQFTVLQGKSNIYLYRNESFGGGVAVPVTLDGKNVGSTGPYTYFKWVVEPGKHVVVSNPKDGKPTRVIVNEKVVSSGFNRSATSTSNIQHLQSLTNRTPKRCSRNSLLRSS